MVAGNTAEPVWSFFVIWVHMGLNEKDKVLFYIFIITEYYVLYTDEYKGLSQVFHCKISIFSFRFFLSLYNQDEQTVLPIFFHF